MSTSTTIASTIGATLGAGAAYGKHAVVATGIGGSGFVADVVRGAIEGYVAKDAELAVKRDEMRTAKALRALPARSVPSIKA